MGAIIKRGTTPVLTIQLLIDDLSSIDRIDFMFKQKLSDADGVPKVLKTYIKDDPESEVQLGGDDNDTFFVPLSEADTRIFKSSSTMYLDVRPITDNDDILATENVEINVYQTLYSDREAAGEG